MVNENKTNNHLSPQTIEYKKTITCGIGNLCLGMEQAKNVSGLNSLYNKILHRIWK